MPVQNMATCSSKTEHMESVTDYDFKCRHAMGVTGDNTSPLKTIAWEARCKRVYLALGSVFFFFVMFCLFVLFCFCFLFLFFSFFLDFLNVLSFCFVLFLFFSFFLDFLNPVT